MAQDLTLVADFSASLYLGLVDSEGKVHAKRIAPREGKSGDLAHALVDECLMDAGASYSRLGGACVGIGPGSFTGIRVAAALIEGLCFAGRLPIHPFSSLRAMVVSMPEEFGPSLALIAATRGRYFALQGDKREEKLVSQAEIEILSKSTDAVIFSGSVPEESRAQIAVHFRHVVHLEPIFSFSSVYRMAVKEKPILDGIIRPNYILPSAAEANLKKPDS